MRILRKHEGSLPNYNTYVVEVPPERRSMFLSSMKAEYYMEMFQIPLPWMIYYILGPSEASLEKGVTLRGLKVHAGWGRPEPVSKDSDEVYFMPFPNIFTAESAQGYYALEAGFSNCVTQYNSMPDLTIEENLAQILNYFWDSPFRYLHRFPEPWKAAYEWLGYRSPPQYQKHYRSIDADYDDIRSLYTKWESISDKEVLTFPWGKMQLPINVNKLDLSKSYK